MQRCGLGSVALRAFLALALVGVSTGLANPYERNGLLASQQEEDEDPCEDPEYLDLLDKSRRREPLTLEEHGRYLEFQRLCLETRRSDRTASAPDALPAAEVPAEAVEETEEGMSSLEAVAIILAVGLVVVGVVLVIAIANMDMSFGGQWGQ